jgi:hypothetical protein
MAERPETKTTGVPGGNSGWRNAMSDRRSFPPGLKHKNKVPTVEHKTPLFR